MGRVYVKDKKTIEMLAKMVPTSDNMMEAFQNQAKFAKAVEKDLNDMIFSSSNEVAVDLNDIVSKIQKGEKIVTLGPARPALRPGDIVTDIYTIDELTPGASASYPVENTGETDYVAIQIPDDGALPERMYSGDEVLVRTFEIGNSAVWKTAYAKKGNVLAINKSRNNFKAGFVKKINDIGWHAILGAGVSRGVVVTDSSATSGEFTRALLVGMMRAMRRLGGGNSASANKFTLTDLFVSVEAMEDILLWDTNQVNATDIFNELIDRGITTYSIHGVKVHVIDELGVDQEYEDYIVNTLGLSHTGSKEEFCVGLDLSKPTTFVMPVAERINVMPMTSLADKRRMGIFGTMELGAAVLDARAVILGEF